jgi:hypothetical protein
MAWTTPRTWTVGAAGTAADLNTYVRDNTSFLYGDVGWTALTLQSGWATTSGWPALAVRLSNNRVSFRGRVSNTTLACTAGARYQIATLPAGYAPPNRTSIPAVFQIAGAASYGGSIVDIQSSTNLGFYSPSAGTGVVAQFDGLSFDIVS